MKTLIILIPILASLGFCIPLIVNKTVAYKPKYKVGECAAHYVPEGFLEKWQARNMYVERIVEVGEHNYRTLSIDNPCAALLANGDKGTTCYHTYAFESFDEMYSHPVANCPRIEDLPGYKKW
jgi:hypothetical protein